jgi:hypothetical protein
MNNETRRGDWAFACAVFYCAWLRHPSSNAGINAMKSVGVGRLSPLRAPAECGVSKSSNGVKDLRRADNAIEAQSSLVDMMAREFVMGLNVATEQRFLF